MHGREKRKDEENQGKTKVTKRSSSGSLKKLASTMTRGEERKRRLPFLGGEWLTSGLHSEPSDMRDVEVTCIKIERLVSRVFILQRGMKTTNSEQTSRGTRYP